MSKVSSANFCVNNKEKLQKKDCKIEQILSNEEKQKRKQYGCPYKNIPKDEKQRLFEYRKKYKMRKKRLIIIIRDFFLKKIMT